MRRAQLALVSAALLAALAPFSTASAQRAPTLETAVFAGGCFWGIEGVFEHVKGVTEAVSGFAGGTLENPDYETVSTGTTGYAESVRVTYDPARVSYGDLLRVFFTVAHDPTQLNRQGPDRGTQYRSAIFYQSEQQRAAATAYVAQLTRAHTFSAPIVTQIVPLRRFYAAEDYHQDFMAHHPLYPYIVINDRPKVEALRRELPQLWQERLAARGSSSR